MLDLYKLLFYKKLGGDSGGGGEAVLINKTITSNGTYNASDDSADGFKKVVASVANSYAAGDEGKVVSSGQLVSQTAHAQVTSNGVVDTTTNNSVEVAVPSSPYLKKTGTFTVATNYTYISSALNAYTGSILVATGLTNIISLLIWSEEWKDQTIDDDKSYGATLCYPAATFNADATDSHVAHWALMQSWLKNTTNYFYGSSMAGPAFHDHFSTIPAGSFGMFTHNNFPILAGQTIHWEAIGT